MELTDRSEQPSTVAPPAQQHGTHQRLDAVARHPPQRRIERIPAHETSTEIGEHDPSQHPAPAARTNQNQQCEAEPGRRPEPGSEIHRPIHPQDELREREVAGSGDEQQHGPGHPVGPETIERGRTPRRFSDDNVLATLLRAGEYTSRADDAQGFTRGHELRSRKKPSSIG